MKRALTAALSLSLALSLVACAPKTVETDAETAVQTPTAADCAARGGTMQPVGRAQTMQCVVRYADAGKRCMTGSDCAGDCRVEQAPFPEAGAAAVGQCQADSRPFGCYARVENGKATPAICVD
ncbi:hypothetical protein ACO2Q1_15550 [Brevundimonas sp. VNH65]|uniref:hypothetical protein n=1 Tax=Brevundimonas sp. VNH65 TaxID=3400917 RepID=UPI003BFF3F6B